LSLLVLGTIVLNPQLFVYTVKDIGEVSATSTATTTTHEEDLLGLLDSLGNSRRDALTSATLGSLAASIDSARADGVVDENEGEQAAEAVTQSIAPLLEAVSFSEKDIFDIVPESPAAKETYHSTLKKLFFPIKDMETPEIALYGKYLETGDYQYLILLRETAVTYQNIVENLKDIPVPRDAVTAHLGATESFARFALVLNALIDSKDDPLSSLSLLKLFNDTEKRMGDDFAKLGVYLSQ
jgi:hypothetical protein